MKKKEYAKLIMDCMTLVELINSVEPDLQTIYEAGAKIEPRLKQALLELIPDAEL